MIIYGVADNFRSLTIPIIKADFLASQQAQGLVNSIGSIGFLVGSMTAAFLQQRTNVRIVSIIGMATFTLTLLILPLSNSFMVTGIVFMLMKGTYSIYQSGLNGIAATFGQAGKMLSFLHSSYGIGAIVGPMLGSFLMTGLATGWRGLFLVAAIPYPLLIGAAIWMKSPERANKPVMEDEVPEKKLTVAAAAKNPLIWLFAAFSGLSGSMEMATVTWGPLHITEVYGVDPVTTGALFLSVYFITFTVMRFICSMVIERVGYVRLEVISSVGTIAMMIAGFLLRERGIWVLACSGLFCAGIFPTMLAVFARTFGRSAPIAMSTISSISCLFGMGNQIIIGSINEYISPAWGYRFTTVFGTIAIALFLFTVRYIRRRKLAVL